MPFSRRCLPAGGALLGFPLPQLLQKQHWCAACDDLLPPPAGSQHRKNGIFTACYSAQYSAQYSVQCTVGDTIGALGNGVFTGLGRGWGLQKFSEPAHESFFGRTRPAACPKTTSVCRFRSTLSDISQPTPRSKRPWVFFYHRDKKTPP